ncbi:MAG TPA: redoxin domain-containing protein [Urbifossiella sp.]|nr:redoxin domain-containing protein [Urbifossiella sp.]
MDSSRLLASALLGLAAAAAVAAADPPPVPAMTRPDPAGKAWAVRPDGAKAVVLLVLSVECPVSNRYAPEMARLAAEFGGKGVVFYGVHPDPEVTPGRAAKHAEEYKLPFPVLLDPDQRLTRAAGATRVPTAVVLGPDGAVRYLGRVDDRHVGVGKSRGEPTRRDLAEAITDVLAGKAPAVSRTPVVGCELPPPAQKRD